MHQPQKKEKKKKKSDQYQKHVVQNRKTHENKVIIDLQCYDETV